MINIALRSMVSRGGFARLEESDVLLYDGAITKSDKESNFFNLLRKKIHRTELTQSSESLSRAAVILRLRCLMTCRPGRHFCNPIAVLTPSAIIP
jgi:hypothetical protein